MEMLLLTDNRGHVSLPTCASETLLLTYLSRWRCGVAVERRTCDQEVVGSRLGRAPRRKNSGQVSHTYVPLSPSSITWYWPEDGDA